MTEKTLAPRALVLSDHDGLYRAIALHLSHYLGMDVVRHELAAPGQRESQAEIGDVDLVVLAQSSPDSEPTIVLARTLLNGCIGQVPTLVISNKPFPSVPGAQVFYLDFPFDIDELYVRVNGILQGGPPRALRANKPDRVDVCHEKSAVRVGT